MVKGGIRRYGFKPLNHIHRFYEARRQRIQKPSKLKPKAPERLLKKHVGSEKNRAKDLRKLATAREILRAVQYSKTLETSREGF